MKLILCGGGSGEQNYHANKKLNEIIDHSKPILYIPLAMDEIEHPYDDCYEWIKGELSNVDVPNIEMVRTFDELSKKELSNYAALFIGGGNTYKLLKGLKENNSFDKISNYINNNGIIIGGSAGAVIFGKDINIISCMDENDVNLNDTLGFDVLNGVSIFPHYTNTKPRLTDEENIERHNLFTEYITNYSYKSDVYAIPEEDAIYINDNNVEVIGSRPYYYFSNGQKQEYDIKKDNFLKNM